MIDPSFDTAELKVAGRTVKVLRSSIPKAYASALNRVGQQVKTRAGRLVREEYNIKAKDVNERIKLYRGSAANPSVELRAKGSNIPIIKFRTNPKEPKDRYAPPPKVLKAAVKRTGMKPIRGAFVTKVGRGGHVGVFKRAGRRRLPIEEVFGPAVPVMLGNERIIDNLETFARDKMEERLDHEIKRQLDKAGGT